MNITILSLILILLGVIIGLLSSTVGLGGGFLIVPILILIFDLPVKNAIAISLVAISGTTISATIGYLKQKRIDFKLGLLYDILDIPGVILGAYLTTFLPSNFLKSLCGIFIICISLVLFSHPDEYRGKKRRTTHDLIGGRTSFKNRGTPRLEKGALQEKGWQRKVIDSSGERFEYILGNRGLALISSFLGGLITGLTGLGGGITDTSTMILLGVPPHVAVATSEFAMALTNGVGVITHGFLRNILFEYALPLAIGTIVGAQMGCRLAKKIKGKFLTKGIAILAFITGLRLLISFSP